MLGGVALYLEDFVRSLGVRLDSTLLLEKEVAVASSAFYQFGLVR